jgi:nucleoside-diphosphate-sugar epimerase
LGAGRWRGTPATVWRNVTPTFIYKALNREALPLENEGVATRDFIFVSDIVEGLMACALKGQSGEAYNIASGSETSIRELAEMINALVGNTMPVKFLPKRSWDSSGRRFGSIEKSSRDLGFRAQVGLEEGLRRTIAWTRENLGVIRAAIAKHESYMRAV